MSDKQVRELVRPFLNVYSAVQHLQEAQMLREKLLECETVFRKVYDLVSKDPWVTVCRSCLRASCWQGVFYCDEYKTAGTIIKTVSELKALALESEDYWTEK